MKPPSHKSAAFSLVEVALAVGIASFAMVALFGLLPVGITSNNTSVEQTNATNIATAIIADLHQAPSAAAVAAGNGQATSPRYGIDVTQPSATIYLDQSGALQANAGAARYRATLTLVQPASGQRTAVYGNLTIGWPSGARTPLGSITTFIGLDRN